MQTSRCVKTLLKHTANFIIQAETDGEEYETDEALIASFVDYLKMISAGGKPVKKQRPKQAPPASYSNDWWTRVIVAVFCTFPCWLFQGAKKAQKTRG